MRGLLRVSAASTSIPQQLAVVIVCRHRRRHQRAELRRQRLHSRRLRQADAHAPLREAIDLVEQAEQRVELRAQLRQRLAGQEGGLAAGAVEKAPRIEFSELLQPIDLAKQLQRLETSRAWLNNIDIAPPLTSSSYFHKLETVKPLRRLPLAHLEAQESHVEAFKALAHPGRLHVFFFLVKARGETAVGEIQQALGLPGPTLSHHLDQLRRAGLITSRREERFVYCAVETALVTDLVRLLTACC